MADKAIKPLLELETEHSFNCMTVVKVKNSLNIVLVATLNLTYLYEHKGKRGDHSLFTRDSPTACTRLSDSRVAVTYPDTNEIVLMKPLPTRLTIWATVTTNKKYTGLGGVNSQRFWALGYVGNKTSLDLLDIRGRVLSSVSYHDEYIKPVSYLTNFPRDESVVISMYSREPVKYVRKNGSVKLSLAEDDVGNSLEEVMGVAVDADSDNLFFADKNLHRVVKVSKDGKTFTTVLTAEDGLKTPSFIDVRDGKVIVGSMDESTVQVYDMKNCISKRKS